MADRDGYFVYNVFMLFIILCLYGCVYGCVACVYH